MEPSALGEGGEESESRLGGRGMRGRSWLATVNVNDRLIACYPFGIAAWASDAR